MAFIAFSNFLIAGHSFLFIFPVTRQVYTCFQEWKIGMAFEP